MGIQTVEDMFVTQSHYIKSASLCMFISRFGFEAYLTMVKHGAMIIRPALGIS